MKIELVSAIDYDKLEKYLKENKVIDKNIEKLLNCIKNLEIKRRAEIVDTAAKLSRSEGNVFDVLELAEYNSLKKNIRFINFVIGLGHSSITEHDYCVFEISDVSPIVEQTIIQERFSSFTIKSRRETESSKIGYYTPIFRDEAFETLANNDQLQEEYRKHEESLFKAYDNLRNLGIKKEDARFISPYSFHANIIMGIDVHTLKDMIIKFTKTKYANIAELKEFGKKLYDIAKVEVPYIVDVIDSAPVQLYSSTEHYLNIKIPKEDYKIIDRPTLLNSSDNIDDTILIAAIMRRYNYGFDQAKKVYEQCDNNFKEELMKKIIFEDDGLELSQVNFQFQIPTSYAVLTHLTRHRTHDLIVPDFVPNPDLRQYKIPPKVKNICLEYYNEIFKNNYELYQKFLNDYHVCQEDLVYFILAGNMTNITTNMNGWDLRHILRLRECLKTQWETRNIAYRIHSEVRKLPRAQLFAKYLGPTCLTQGVCHEGKDACDAKDKILKKVNNK